MRSVAILAPNMETGRGWVRRCEQQGNLVTFCPAEMSGVARFMGVDRPFVVCTRVEHIRGMDLVGYEAHGPVGWNLTECARLQVRS